MGGRWLHPFFFTNFKLDCSLLFRSGRSECDYIKEEYLKYWNTRFSGRTVVCTTIVTWSMVSRSMR